MKTKNFIFLGLPDNNSFELDDNNTETEINTTRHRVLGNDELNKLVKKYICGKEIDELLSNLDDDKDI